MKALFCAALLLVAGATAWADDAAPSQQDTPTAVPTPQPMTVEGDKALAAGQYTLAEKDYLKATDADPTDQAAWRGLVSLWEREGLQDHADWAYDHLARVIPSPKDSGYLVVRGWSAPAGSVAGYNLYISDKEKGGLHKANDAMITGLSFLVTGLDKGKTYYFVLTAFTTDSPPVESKPSTTFSMLCPTEHTVPKF
jgi:hypothetical protein